MVIDFAAVWAPALLIHEENCVREGALRLLGDVIFSHFPDELGQDNEMDQLEDTDMHTRTIVVRALFFKCLPKVVDGWRNQCSRYEFTDLIKATGLCVKWIRDLADGLGKERFIVKQDDERILREWTKFVERIEEWQDDDVDDVLTGESVSIGQITGSLLSNADDNVR